LSDLHYDSQYTVGLSNDCGEPLCCRPPNPKGNGQTAAGYWGDYKCDVPYQTLENLMQHLASIKDQVLLM
jgi:sphingomyelin phosphodiesterase